MRLRGLSCVALAAGLALWVSPRVHAGEIRRVEAVGAIPLGPEITPSGPPRDAAVRAALRDAALRLALDLLSTDFDPIEAESAILEALGDDPFLYATRFRILEDRGEGPALFVNDLEVKSEYIVVVEAHLDLDRIRQRMAARGLVAPAGEARRVQVRVVMEGLGTYEAFQSLRRILLEDLGVRSAVPVEMQRGRVVLKVVSDRKGPELLDDMLAVLPPELQIVPVASDDKTVRFRVWEGPGPATSPAIDTPELNRY